MYFFFFFCWFKLRLFFFLDLDWKWWINSKSFQLVCMFVLDKLLFTYVCICQIWCHALIFLEKIWPLGCNRMITLAFRFYITTINFSKLIVNYKLDLHVNKLFILVLFIEVVIRINIFVQFSRRRYMKLKNCHPSTEVIMKMKWQEDCDAESSSYYSWLSVTVWVLRMINRIQWNLVVNENCSAFIFNN